ncbi:SDR family oxidoreductase [Uliginosibacterium gangwonense]|uniref:SDR family oxidoreductase n=1 Tax=Uliginosibacterium gangwonense TaxID=392736 RepID=UPI00039A1027|nr:SDR family oxidoreductase [Uliginosibacterium gangwonense]
MNRLLIIGCGDVASRALPWLRRRFRVYALVRNMAGAQALRAQGITPILGDLDQPRSLKRLAGLAHYVLHSAPPAETTTDDARTRRLLATLAQGQSLARAMVYISTTGVYGDCQGACVDESRPLRPATARAQRRVAAEQCLRRFASRQGCALRILRAPGIYAAQRLPLARLRQASPVLCAQEDVYTNHVHADDLAHAACLALLRGPRLRVYNVCDDTHLKMGDWYDALADAAGLPRPPRATWAECAASLSPATLSFMGESRRICNTRIKRELRWQPAYPDVVAALPQLLKD